MTLEKTYCCMPKNMPQASGFLCLYLASNIPIERLDSLCCRDAPIKHVFLSNLHVASHQCSKATCSYFSAKLLDFFSSSFLTCHRCEGVTGRSYWTSYYCLWFSWRSSLFRSMIQVNSRISFGVKLFNISQNNCDMMNPLTELLMGCVFQVQERLS